MKKKTYALLSSGLVVAVATSLFLSKMKGPEKVNLALTALLQENFYAAEELITEMGSKSSASDRALYHGFLSQAMGNYTESDGYFSQALSSVRLPTKGHEILQALALNKFLNCRFDELQRVCETAIHPGISFPQNSKHLPFFRGSIEYATGHFKEAAFDFASYAALNPTYEKTTWLDHIMEKRFPKEWFETHIAYCLFEEGDVNGATLKLEPLLGESSFATELLAITTLKGSHTLSDEKREEALKLALFYLEKTPHTKHFPLDEERLSLHLKKEIEALFIHGKFDKATLSFIAILEKWGRDKEICDLANSLTQSRFEKDPESLEHLFKNVRKSQTPLFYAYLNEKIADSFYKQISSASAQNLGVAWDSFELTAFSYPKVKATALQLLEEKMLSVILNDNASLGSTNDLLHLWKRIQGPRSGKNGTPIATLAQKLTHQGKLIWLKEGEEDKGTHLFQLALTLTNKKESKEMLKDLELFFKKLYTAAEGANMVGRLGRIYDATDALKLDSTHLCPKGSLANYVADAGYLFSSRNYAAAKTNAELVLKIDPQNQGAIKLIGLSCYHLGDYGTATLFLQKLETLDEHAEKALCLCQSSNIKREEKQLVQVDTLDELEEDE